MSKISRSLPLKPLSVNIAWKGRRFKTKDYNQFRHDFGMVAVGGQQIKGWVYLDITFTLTKETFAISDVDNLLKPVLDGIVDRGYIEDDRKVLRIVARKELGPDYRIDFTIFPA